MAEEYRLRNERLKEEIAHAAAKFLAEESSGKSLITVTRAEISGRAERLNIFLSVFPESAEAEALEFANRKRGVLHQHLSENFRLSRIPFLEFIIDRGEKNRQHLDEISRKP